MSFRPLPRQVAELGIDDIYAIDTEYRPPEPDAYSRYDLSPDCAPAVFEPVCISVKSWATGRTESFWYHPGDPCLWNFDATKLTAFFNAPADLRFFLAAGWELPSNIVDTYAEYRRAVNGHFDMHGKRVGQDEHKRDKGRRYSLLSATLHYGVGGRTGAEKRSMVTRIMAGPPYSEHEKEAIIQYNRDDVEDTENLLSAMMDSGDIENLGQALLRGDATRGFAVRDLNGLPVDRELVERLKKNWQMIRVDLAREVEARNHYDVFRFDPDGTVQFDARKATALVFRLDMRDIWPKTDTGKFSFADPDRGRDADNPLKKMALINPYLQDLRETKRLLERFKTFDLSIGRDGRCRGHYFPFVQSTGRSSPGKGSIFSMPKFTRFLVKPGPGRGIAYIDLKSAEFAIAAALSHDEVMQQDYRDMLSGKIECVYFELAKRSGQVPPDALLKDHRPVRALWKLACLAMMYGQSPEGLATATNIPLSMARVIHDAFRRRYSTYWTWVQREVVHAHANGFIQTVCGWKLSVNDRTEDPTLLNFHCQATCADVMRRAVALMADRGIAICEIVHDAVVVEAPAESLQAHVEDAKDCWRLAGEEILGLPIDADSKECIYPDRFEDQDGKAMWDVLMVLLTKAERRISGRVPGGPDVTEGPQLSSPTAKNIAVPPEANKG